MKKRYFMAIIRNMEEERPTILLERMFREKRLKNQMRSILKMIRPKKDLFTLFKAGIRKRVIDKLRE